MSHTDLTNIDQLLERLARKEFDLLATGRALIANDWPCLSSSASCP